MALFSSNRQHLIIDFCEFTKAKFQNTNFRTVWLKPQLSCSLGCLIQFEVALNFPLTPALLFYIGLQPQHWWVERLMPFCQLYCILDIVSSNCSDRRYWVRLYRRRASLRKQPYNSSNPSSVGRDLRSYQIHSVPDTPDSRRDSLPCLGLVRLSFGNLWGFMSTDRSLFFPSRIWFGLPKTIPLL